jgi:hypothetical protein
VRFDSRRCECKKLNIVAANALDDFCNGVERRSHRESVGLRCSRAVLAVSAADEETRKSKEGDDSRSLHDPIV